MIAVNVVLYSLPSHFDIVPASLQHLAQLVKLEQRCFDVDMLSKRSFKRFIASEQAVFYVAIVDQQCIGYVLIIFHRGTRLARLYSIAVDIPWRRQGIGRALMHIAEQQAADAGALYFRLEVALANHSAIGLYRGLGFKEFGLWQDYYADHSDALRMQKRIRSYQRATVIANVSWYQQTTPFTCGPAALMMAMSALQPEHQPNLSEELQLWREATTIYMTSGHGGCHPLGLALAAKRRGFAVSAWINQSGPLFIDGVRSGEKKAIIEQVHSDFVDQCQQATIPVYYDNIGQQTLVDACRSGAVPVILISTYRMDRKKAPHWVVVTGFDDHCFYLHDPDPDEMHQDVLDCQHLPIARDDFERMSLFGRNRLRTAIILRAPK